MKAVPLPLANPPAQRRLCVPKSAPSLPKGRAVQNRPSSSLEPPRPLARISAPALLALWHLASFDAPTVAVVWAASFAWSMHLRLPLWVLLLLALVTWSVYIGDRLLDAHAGLHSPHRRQLRKRHFFHWRHRHILIPLAVAAAATAAAIVFSLMPPLTRARDSLLGAAALMYFSGVHSRRRPPAWLAPLLSKEFLVAVLFTAGCVLPAWTRLHALAASFSALWPLDVFVLYFAALAWLNCLAISRWESKAHAARQTGVLPLGCWLGLAGAILALMLSAASPRAAAVLAMGALSALLLTLLDRMRNRLAPLALRAAADLVLLTPLLLIPLARFFA